MLAKVQQIDGAWQRLQSSRAWKKAEDGCGIAALCLVTTADLQPRYMGDNEGVHPSRLVVTTKDPKDAIDKYIPGVHSDAGLYYTRAYVYWPTFQHAKLAKSWIEKTEEYQHLRLLNGWWNIDPWQFEMAIKDAAAAIGEPYFDGRERALRIWAIAKRGSR